MRLRTEYLTFAIRDDASGAQFIVNEDQTAVSERSDFWRLILDDGYHTELTVHSYMQNGRVKETDSGLVVEYDQLISEYGEAYPIRLVIRIDIEDGLLRFTPEIKNATETVRVDECFCPLAEFTQLCGDKRNDALFMPFGLGERKQDPWGYLDSEEVISDYYSHNEVESYYHHFYPGTASMGWFGIESGNRFLYVAQYDPDHRYCYLTVRQTIHSDPTNLMIGIDHFPMTRPGECMTLSPVVIGMLEGNWRAGSKRYREWADRSFYSAPVKPAWVTEMTGWQRVIMRSQWGHDYYKPEDLPQMYLNGAKYGIHTLFLFGWFKGGFDRNYPDAFYEPMDGLIENIKKVQAMGGRVILHFLASGVDPHSDFYTKRGGDDVRILDINGNIPPVNYTFPALGELRINHGKRWVVSCCAGSRIWRRELMNIVRLQHSLGCDCVFADTYGGFPATPCFNDKHDHGPRVDEEWISRTKFLREAFEYTERQHIAFGSEWPTDAVASYVHFVHGLMNVHFRDGSDVFPAMFRYTFPEVITTEREIRCSEGRYERRLKGALTAGLRLDCELFVCRGTLDKDPKLAEAVKRYTDKLYEYREFFFDGQYTVLDDRLLPKHFKRGEYLSKDGTKVLRVLLNGSDHEDCAFDVGLAADEIRFDVFDLQDYLKKLEPDK